MTRLIFIAHLNKERISIVGELTQSTHLMRVPSSTPSLHIDLMAQTRVFLVAAFDGFAAGGIRFNRH